MTRNQLRALGSTILIIIGALAVSAAVATHWLDTVLLDTDTFIAAAEPLLADPAVIETSSERIASALLDRLDVAALAEENVPEVLRPFVATLAQDFEGFVREQVGAAVDSKGFAALTRARLRAWHLTFASAVTAQGDEATLEGTTLRVTLGPYIDLLAEKTDQSLLRLALGQVPNELRDAEVDVLDASAFADRLPQLQALHAAQPFLPYIALAALAGGLALAPRRDWAVVSTGAALIASGGLLLSVADSEAARITALLSRTLGASVDAAAQTVDLLASPLQGWATRVVWAGVAVAIVGAGLVYWRTYAGRPPLSDVGEPDSVSVSEQQA